MKAIITFLTAILFIVNFSAQTLKTYTGVYENGKAVYQYYENEKADRIYEGSFSYITKTYNILGLFKENKRAGKWKISAVNKFILKGKEKLGVNTLISGSYLNGNMDGVWTFSNATKTFNPKTKKASPKAEKVIANASFKDNHFIGKFAFDKTLLTKTFITGQFTDAGFVDGVWSVKRPKIIEEIKYKNGIEYSKIVKDITTGDKIISYDSSAFQEQFWKMYNFETKMAKMNDKVYFLDTIESQNQAITLWSSDIYAVEKFGTIINPLYHFKRGQNSPHAYEIKIVACENNTDCYKQFMQQKNAELERIQQEQNAETEKLRVEALEKEELLRIEKENEVKKELERVKVETITINIKTAEKLEVEKNYKDAIIAYQKANELQYSEVVGMKIIEAQKQIHRIDSLHEMKGKIYTNMNKTATDAFSKTAELQIPLKNKKKVYASNYILCTDYLKINFNTKNDLLTKIMEENGQNKDFWTELDEKSVVQIKELQILADEVSKFQAAVLDASTKNNKAKLRVLNSSINPKTIVYDMIHFKMN